MSELDPFETRFAAAYRRYLAEAPVEADLVAVARRVAAAAPRRQRLAGFRPFGLTPAMAWILLLTGLLLALVVGGLVVGTRRPYQAVVVVPQTPATTPTPAPSPSPWGTAAPAGSMTTARDWHAATLLADGRVLIAGGANNSGDLATAELYDPKIDTFSPTGSMMTARDLHTATLLADGRVLIAGGRTGSAEEGLATAEIHDPKTGTFGPTGPMAAARFGDRATLLPDGRVLITGGLNASAREGLAPARRS